MATPGTTGHGAVPSARTHPHRCHQRPRRRSRPGVTEPLPVRIRSNGKRCGGNLLGEATKEKEPYDSERRVNNPGKRWEELAIEAESANGLKDLALACYGKSLVSLWASSIVVLVSSFVSVPPAIVETNCPPTSPPRTMPVSSRVHNDESPDASSCEQSEFNLGWSNTFERRPQRWGFEVAFDVD